MWDLDLDADDDPTAGDRRHEPNLRMAWLAELGEFPDADNVLGVFDESVPSGGWTGWAGYGVAWTKPVAETPAHEVGHTQGLQHVACKDDDGDDVPDEAAGGAIDWSHPTGLPPVCSLAPINPDGYFGFTNYRSPTIIYSNDPTHPLAAFPFMSYQNPGWTDPYHWCQLLDAYGVDCNPALVGVPPQNPFQNIDCEPEAVGDGIQLELCVADGLPPAEPLPADPLGGPVVAVHGTNAVGMETITLQAEGMTFDIPLDPESWVIASGTIDLHERTGSIAQAATRDELSPGTAGLHAETVEAVAAGGASTAFALQLVGADGTPLVVVPVAVDGAGRQGSPAHGGGAERGSATGYFSPIPWVEGATAIELVVDGAVVDSRPISATPPEVTDVEAIAGAEATTLRWQAVDPDSGAAEGLTYTVLWSADGETWVPAAVDVGATELTVPTSSRFPGGTETHVEVIANDGVNTGEATSAAFAAPTHAPVVAIAGAPRGPVEQYDLVELTAVVDDPEAVGGMDILGIAWTGPTFGSTTGPVLSTRDLPVGPNTISVVVTDGDGNEARAEVVIEVIERTSPTRYTESPDPAAVEFLTNEFTTPTTTTTTAIDDVAAAITTTTFSPTDADGDGLTNDEEAEIGSDPAQPGHRRRRPDRRRGGVPRHRPDEPRHRWRRVRRPRRRAVRDQPARPRGPPVTGLTDRRQDRQEHPARRRAGSLSFGGFGERLRQRRVDEQALDDVGDLEVRRDGEGDHRDQLGGVPADDRATEDDTRRRVGHDLDESLRVVVDQRLGGGRERDLGDTNLPAGGERLGLGETDVGDLRLGEDRRRRLVVVEVAVRSGVQPHDPLGHLAALHRRDRRERELAADVAGGVDVRNAGDAVVVDREVATRIDLDTGTFEVEAIRVGHRSDRQHRVGGAHDATVVAPDHHAVALVIALDRRRPRPLEQAHTAGEEVRLEHGGDFRILVRQHLLAGNDQRHLGTERGEHVHELDAGDTRADDGDAARELLGRVAVACRQDAITVGFAPVRDARPRAGGDQGDVEVELLDTIDRVDFDGVR